MYGLLFKRIYHRYLNKTLLSPTVAALLSLRLTNNNNLIIDGSPRQRVNNNPFIGTTPVVVTETNDFSPMKQNVANGFSMTTPIVNVTCSYLLFRTK